MKRCPQCNRVETDNALVYCRVDGAALLSEHTAVASEAGTAQFARDPTEDNTSLLPHNTQINVARTTGPTTVLPAASIPPTKALGGSASRKGVLLAVAVVLVLVIGIVGIFIARNLNAVKNDQGF